MLTQLHELKLIALKHILDNKFFILILVYKLALIRCYSFEILYI